MIIAVVLLYFTQALLTLDPMKEPSAVYTPCRHKLLSSGWLLYNQGGMGEAMNDIRRKILAGPESPKYNWQCL